LVDFKVEDERDMENEDDNLADEGCDGESDEVSSVDLAAVVEQDEKRISINLDDIAADGYVFVREEVKVGDNDDGKEYTQSRAEQFTPLDVTEQEDVIQPRVWDYSPVQSPSVATDDPRREERRRRVSEAALAVDRALGLFCDDGSLRQEILVDADEDSGRKREGGNYNVVLREVIAPQVETEVVSRGRGEARDMRRVSFEDHEASAAIKKEEPGGAMSIWRSLRDQGVVPLALQRKPETRKILGEVASDLSEELLAQLMFVRRQTAERNRLELVYHSAFIILMAIL
jgi:hypothetical protein